MVEITSEEQNKVKRIKRTEDNLRDPWDNIKCTNIQVIGIPEEEKRKGYEKIFDYFPFLVGDIFNYKLFKNFLIPFLFHSSSGNPIIHMLVHLILSQRSLRLSSVLFILFLLFCSSEVISTILSSSSLIGSSASNILLLIPLEYF